MKRTLFFLTVVLVFLTFTFCSKNAEEETDLQSPTTSVSSDAVVSMDELSTKPQIIKKTLPEYPEAAKKAGIEGRAVVQVTILEDGSVSDAKILQSSGNEALDQSAIRAAKEFNFSPGKVNEKVVQTQVAIPFQFKLEDKR